MVQPSTKKEMAVFGSPESTRDPPTPTIKRQPWEAPTPERPPTPDPDALELPLVPPDFVNPGMDTGVARELMLLMASPALNEKKMNRARMAEKSLLSGSPQTLDFDEEAEPEPEGPPAEVVTVPEPGTAGAEREVDDRVVLSPALFSAAKRLLAGGVGEKKGLLEGQLAVVTKVNSLGYVSVQRESDGAVLTGFQKEDLATALSPEGAAAAAAAEHERLHQTRVNRYAAAAPSSSAASAVAAPRRQLGAAAMMASSSTPKRGGPIRSGDLKRAVGSSPLDSPDKREQSERLALVGGVLEQISPDDASEECGFGLPLHQAAHNGHGEVVAKLIAFGADVESRNKYSRTALHLAAASGSPAAVKALIRGGAPIDSQNDYGKTALDVVSQEPDADARETRRILQLAFDEKAEYERLAAGEAPNSKGQLKSALEEAARTGDEEACLLAVEVALRQPGLKLDGKDELGVHGATPLAQAVMNGHVRVVVRLCEADAKVNAKDEEQGFTPLMYVYIGISAPAVDIWIRAPAVYIRIPLQVRRGERRRGGGGGAARVRREPGGHEPQGQHGAGRGAEVHKDRFSCCL